MDDERHGRAVESLRGRPRYQRAVRDQMKIEMRALEQLLPSDHAARVVWEFVRKLDLAEFYAGIKAVEGRPEQPPVDPAILLALWLLATIEGVGSARELAWLCTTAAQAVYGLRPSIAEFPNAMFRNRGLRQFLVRGLKKVKAATL